MRSMQENCTLKGHAVLVTGAGSGLGEATARAFAAAGCVVSCLDINRAEVERVCRELRNAGAVSQALVCDIRDAESIAQVTQQVVALAGRLDILVNAAAIDYTCSVEEMSLEQWDAEMAVNLRAPFLFVRAAFPWMKKQGSGHIFNVASTAALRAWGNASAYHASKWGLLGFSRGLSVEGRAHGIRVTTIIPGGMQTHFFDRLASQGIPLPDPHFLQDPAAVAQTMVFAARTPSRSVIQELLITPLNETSWP